MGRIDYEYSRLLLLAQEWADAVFKLSLGESYGGERATHYPTRDLAALWKLDEWVDSQTSQVYNSMKAIVVMGEMECTNISPEPYSILSELMTVPEEMELHISPSH